MEAAFWAKRTLFNIPKILPQGPPGIQSTRRVTRACLSTAYERAEGSNGAVEGEGSSEISDAPREGMYEAKHQSFNAGEGRPPPGSTTSFPAETARDGIKKAAEVAENVGDKAKKTLDGAWKAAKDTAQVIKERATESVDDEIEEDEAVDEVRSIEELRAKAGGYDKAH